MAKHREKGDGSIYQRASDNMYVAYARMPDTNKKKYVYAKTRTEAVKKLKELQRSIEQGTLITAKSETVEAYLLYWLEIHKAKLKPTTYAMYHGYLITCIKHIGQIKLSKLASIHLLKMYADLSQTHKPNSIRTIHGIIKIAVKSAIRWKRMAHNPCDDMDAPGNTQHDERPILEEVQAKALLNAAQGTYIECFLIMALTTGMRRGEMLGLRWADIDIEGKVLKIQRTASYVKLVGEKYKFVETTPKTQYSRRSILLTDFLIAALKAHKKKQLEARLQAGQEWANKDLVFCNHVGEHFTINRLTMRYQKLLQECCLPQLHIHDLRHSAATLLASMNVPTKVIQEILGHSSIVVTQNIYGHVIDKMQEDAAHKMNDLFNENGTN